MRRLEESAEAAFAAEDKLSGPLKRRGCCDDDARITQQQLESYLWGAATLLRGTIDAGDYKQFIFPLLFYKRLCDVFDEETQTALAESGGDDEFAAYPENHRFQIPRGATGAEVRQGARNVGQAAPNRHARHRDRQPGQALRHLRRRPVDQQGPPVRRHAARPGRAFLAARRSPSPTCPRTSWARATST